VLFTAAVMITWVFLVREFSNSWRPASHRQLAIKPVGVLASATTRSFFAPPLIRHPWQHWGTGFCTSFVSLFTGPDSHPGK
jgi:hypothetical protein